MVEAVILTPIGEKGERGTSTIYDVSKQEQGVVRRVGDVSGKKTKTKKGQRIKEVEVKGDKFTFVTETKKVSTSKVPSPAENVYRKNFSTNQLNTMELRKDSLYFKIPNAPYDPNKLNIYTAPRESAKTDYTISRQEVEMIQPKPIGEPTRRVSKSESFVNKVSNFVDYPVTLAKKGAEQPANKLISSFIKQDTLKATAVKYSPYPYANSLNRAFARDFIKGTFEVSSYAVPVYGQTRFSKDVGVYGYNVFSKPSYAFNEGLGETVMFAGIGAVGLGAKGYRYFYRDPLLKEFKSVEQTGFDKAIEKKVVRSSFVRGTSKDGAIVLGVDPNATSQLLKASKSTSVYETVKGGLVRFKLKDSSVFLSREGERSLKLDFDSGVSRQTDIFTVKRFGRSKDYVKIVESSPSGDTTVRVFDVSKGSKPVINIVSKPSESVSLTLKGIKRSISDEPLREDRRLFSLGSVRQSQTKFIGSKDSGYIVNIDRSRFVSQEITLDKYYSVRTSKELGYVANKKGLSIAPIESSKTIKTSLDFGIEGVRLNERTLKGYAVESFKFPQSKEVVKISEDVNLLFTKTSKKESKRLFNQYIKSMPTEKKVLGGTLYTFPEENPFNIVEKRKSKGLFAFTKNSKGKFYNFEDYKKIASKKVKSLGLRTEVTQISKEEQITLFSPRVKVDSSFNRLSISSPSLASEESSFFKFNIKSSPKSEIKPVSSQNFNLINISKRKLRTDNAFISKSTSRFEYKPKIKPEVIIKQEVRSKQRRKFILDTPYKQDLKQELIQVPKRKTESVTIPKSVGLGYREPRTFKPKIPFFAIPRFKSSKGRSSIKYNFPKSKVLYKSSPTFKFRALASLPEVFSYEGRTGKEAILPKETKRIKRLFNLQLSGYNAGSLIPVEQERKKRGF